VVTFTVLGTGFIGSHVQAYLREQGYACNAVPRSEFDHLAGRRLGHVIDCIGVTADFRSRPLEAVQAHVCRLVDILTSTEFDSLLYLSSTRVYDPHSSGRETEHAFRVDPMRLSDVYNLSKLTGESVCFAVGRPAVRVARLSNVYGPDWTSDDFLSAIIRQIGGGSVLFHSAPESAKDYICIDDAVRVLVDISLRGRERLYNVASGRNITNAQIAERLEELGYRTEFEKAAPVVRFPDIDNTRIREEFAFSPRSVLDDLPALLEDYSQWSQERPNVR
jgi:nucleoside-diphosphate-sugar epimerase